MITFKFRLIFLSVIAMAETVLQIITEEVDVNETITIIQLLLLAVLVTATVILLAVVVANKKRN